MELYACSPQENSYLLGIGIKNTCWNNAEISAEEGRWTNFSKMKEAKYIKKTTKTTYVNHEKEWRPGKE